MENLEKKQLDEKTKMEILKALHEIIYDANYFLGKVANVDSAEFDYEQFKKDYDLHLRYLRSDYLYFEQIEL